MSYWNDLRKEVGNKSIASNITRSVYKQVAASGVNMLGIIKPAFYIGHISSLTYEYISYVEKFLQAEECDWGEYLQFALYLREISKKFLTNIENLRWPLNELIRSVEEIFEGERYSSDEEYEEELEPERIEEPGNIEEFLSGEDEEIEAEDEEPPVDDSKLTREELTADYRALKEKLLTKIRQMEDPERGMEEFSRKITDVFASRFRSSNVCIEELSRKIADVYLECVQLNRELERLQRCPEGDLSTLLSILVDIQFGLCTEMKRHLMEDVIVDESFNFKPGLLTWSSLFLANFSEKINRELQMEETTGS